MKPSGLVAVLVGTACAQLVAFPWMIEKAKPPGAGGDGINRVAEKPATDGDGNQLFHIQKQSPLENMYERPLIPGSGVPPPGMGPGSGPVRGPALLQTEMSVNQDVSIFASYAREFESVQSRFGNKHKYSVVLAPSDAAMVKLTKKPWQFPYEAQDSSPEAKDSAARMNAGNFVMHHVHYGEISEIGSVAILGANGGPESFELSTEGGSKLRVEPNQDETLTITTIDGRNGGSITAKVMKARPVENGVVWILDTCLLTPENYA